MGGDIEFGVTGSFIVIDDKLIRERTREERDQNYHLRAGGLSGGKVILGSTALFVPLNPLRRLLDMVLRSRSNEVPSSERSRAEEMGGREEEV